MPDWLGHRAAAFPHRLALVADAERLTFGELDRRVNQTARRLAALGVTPGARVALLLRNGTPFVVLTHALARLGAVMVPLNVRLAPVEMAWQVQDARASLLLVDNAFAEVAVRTARDAPAARAIVLDRLAATPEAEVSLRGRIDLSAPQGIIYTSATSGKPKGVLLSFGNHWWSAMGSALNLGLHRDDCWLAPLPLYHVGGLAILWRSVIYGIPAVVQETFDVNAVNREIDHGGATVVSVVGTMLQRLLDARGGRPYPASLRCILLGGGPAPRAVIERCLELGVPVAPTYGLTEAASQVATLTPDELARKPGSAGKPLFPIELRIDHGGSQAPTAPGAAGEIGTPRAAGEIGEILVRGPTVMLGYAGRPDDTTRALRGGWLHTDDLGYLDGDGYLFVVDRQDDLIISGGENVYPAEVEAVLLEHPAIEDAGVVGLPDPLWGQTVAAAVRVRSGATLTDEGVKAFCAARLAGYKIPRRVWYVEDLPRSPGGKLVRRAIRESALDALGRERA
ncbi:MAG: o-succinylbenzoate--CoA ligase [Armatimonadota bacterium]